MNTVPTIAQADAVFVYDYWCALLCIHFALLITGTLKVSVFRHGHHAWSAVLAHSYMMWALADHHARDHWWLKQNYDPERSAGHYLLTSYRHVASSTISSCPESCLSSCSGWRMAPCRAAAEAFVQQSVSPACLVCAGPSWAFRAGSGAAAGTLCFSTLIRGLSGTISP